MWTQSAAGKYSNGVPNRSSLMFCLVLNLIIPELQKHKQFKTTKTYTSAHTMQNNIGKLKLILIALFSRCIVQLKSNARIQAETNVSQQCATKKIIDPLQPSDLMMTSSSDASNLYASQNLDRGIESWISPVTKTQPHDNDGFENKTLRTQRINTF